VAARRWLCRPRRGEDSTMIGHCTSGRRNIRLVACDIDGTLVSRHELLTPEAYLAKRICDERGVFFTLATGRVSSSAELVARDLGVTAPVITNGGAAIKVPGKEYVRVLVIERDAACRAIEVGRRHGAERYIYTGEQYLTETPGEHVAPYSQGIGIPIHPVKDLCEHATDGAMSVVLRFNPAGDDTDEEVSSLLGELRDVALGGFRVSRSLRHMIEVAHPAAGKGEALKTLAAYLGVRIEETLAVGDSIGDLEMLDAAGIGVLVANAPPEILSPGRRVTKGAFSAGVLEAVRTYVSGE